MVPESVFLLTDVMCRVMDDEYGRLLFDDDLSSEQRATLRKKLEADPAFAEEWARWQQVRARLRDRLRRRLPDRRLLVLYALDEDGHGDLLSPDEVEALGAARDEIADAVEAIPALQQVVERIQDERADFEAVWTQHREELRTGAAGDDRRPQPNRRERSPRRSDAARGTATGHRWAWRLTVAALLLGAAVLAIVYGPQEANRTTVTAGVDETRVVEFGDGSTARLVGAASLSYTPGMSTAEERRVTLTRGRAYFDVVPREETSFVVATPAARTEALGTQFTVTTGTDTTEVVLVDGRVRVGPDDEDEGGPVTLAPGERSTVRNGAAPTPPRAVDLTASLEWTGLFVFRAVPTATIADRLGRHYDVSIDVAPALADEPVTGTFDREQPVEHVLETIARTLGANVRGGDGAYRLEPSS